MKKKVIIGIIIAVVLVIIVVLGIDYWKHTKSLSYDTEFDQILFAEQGEVSEQSMSFISKEEYRLNLLQNALLGQYVMDCHVKGKEYYSWEKGIDKYIYKTAEIEFFNFVTGEIEKTIDIKEITEKYVPGFQWDMWGPYIEATSDSIYISWGTLNPEIQIPDAWHEGRQMVNVNYDTGKVIVGDLNIGELSEEQKKWSHNTSFLYFMDTNFLKSNGFISYSPDDGFQKDTVYFFHYYGWDMGIVGVQMTFSTLPKKNEALYSEFPKLKEYEGNENDIVTLYLGGYPTAEEVMKMIMEEGNEISFEGCVLPANESIDGEEHEIHSFEEYEQWKK